MPTLPDRIIKLLQQNPGLSDREITNRLKGADAPQQPVNQTCRLLAKRGVLSRRKRPDGRIGNYVLNMGLQSSGKSAVQSNDVLSEDSIEEEKRMIKDLLFENEEQLRNWLQKELRRKLAHHYSKYIVLDSKNVNDILITKECSFMPIVAFIEVKYYKHSFGRIGIGDGKGKGFQPEILIKKPAYFEKYMRWLVASEDDVAVFVDNETVRKFAAAGHIEKGKHNNIQTAIFNNTAIGTFSISKSSCVIIEWLESL